MSDFQPRRSSSEYSQGTGSVFTETKEKPKVSKEEKKKARGHIYKLVFSTWMGKIALVPSFLCGAIPICIYLVFGQVINSLTEYFMAVAMNAQDPSVYIPADETMAIVSKHSWYMAIVAIGSGLMKFFDQFFWIRLGSFCSTKMKHDLFVSMMKNDVKFFDINPIGSVLSMLTEDAEQVMNAFGTTKGLQIQNIGQFLVGIILAYIYSWRLALVATATIPLIFVTFLAMMPRILKNSILKFTHLAESITIAEETLSSIRTVRGFNREKKEIKRFINETKLSAKYERNIGMLMTVGIAIIQIIIWGATLGNLYWGATLVDAGTMETGDLFSVYGFTMFGCMGLIMMQTTLNQEQKAMDSGARIMRLTETHPEIPFDGGDIVEDFKGHIEFRNVSFKYPTRDVYVLKNVSFIIKPGQMGALVGHSGSGKSTCVQLLERFYDVTEGLILLDGHDIQTLDPRWLHRQMALVSQEPTLFHTTIKNNIIYGAPDATMEQVIEAATIANAAKFIERLDHKYDQEVGERGSSLSGGQRQRIAIARSVIKNPIILITDEATSALDSQSEKKVQYALDKVMENRTAVVVAHRLSTIRNAHVIYVFDSGEIKEVGTHDSLIKLGGFYYTLVERQLTQEDTMKKKNADMLKETPQILESGNNINETAIPSKNKNVEESPVQSYSSSSSDEDDTSSSK